MIPKEWLENVEGEPQEAEMTFDHISDPFERKRAVLRYEYERLNKQRAKELKEFGAKEPKVVVNDIEWSAYEVGEEPKIFD